MGGGTSSYDDSEPRVYAYSQCAKNRRRTSSDSLEFPHPNIKILAFLSGTNSRMIGAISEYVLNQSNESSSDSLLFFQRADTPIHKLGFFVLLAKEVLVRSLTDCNVGP